MRSVTVETVTGRVDTSGYVYEGPCTCQKVAQGRYWIFAPPGKRLLAISAIGFTFPQWAFVQSADYNGRGVLIIFANQASTVEVDANFVFTAILAA